MISAKSYTFAAKNCFADYLKSRGIEVQDFGTCKTLTELCIETAENEKLKQLELLRSKTAAKKDPKLVDCIMKGLTNLEIGDMLLHSNIYKNENGSVAAEYATKFDSIRMSAMKVHSMTTIKCEAEKKFIKILISEENELTDPKRDYCIRKRIIDYKLLALDNVELELNPRNLDTTKINCEILHRQILKDSKDSAVRKIMKEVSKEDDRDKRVSCLLRSVSDNSFLDQSLQFKYVKELDLDDEATEQMRKKFLELTMEWMETFLECYASDHVIRRS